MKEPNARIDNGKDGLHLQVPRSVAKKLGFPEGKTTQRGQFGDQPLIVDVISDPQTDSAQQSGVGYDR